MALNLKFFSDSVTLYYETLGVYKHIFSPKKILINKEVVPQILSYCC